MVRCSFPQSPGEIKSMEVDLGCHSRIMDCLAAELFLNSCFSDTVCVTLFPPAVERAISEVQKLLRICGGRGVPTSLTLLLWRWLAVSSVSSVFTGRTQSARTSNVY